MDKTFNFSKHVEYMDVLGRREGFRRKFQSIASKTAAEEQLVQQGLARFKDFDQRRAATMPEVGLLFRESSSGIPAAPFTKESVEKLPLHIRTLLTEFDTTLMVGHTARDISPTVAKFITSSIAGKTWEAVAAGGFFTEGRLVGVFNNNACKIGMNCRLQTLRTTQHEIGHAINLYLGNFANSPEFVAAYKKDMPRLIKRLESLHKRNKIKPKAAEDIVINKASTVRPELMTYFDTKAYALKENGGNVVTIEEATGEAFAELTADYLNKRMFGKDKDFKNVVPLSNYMPASMVVVEKLMADLERYYAFAPKPLIPH